jgi:hypothetical protein
MKLINFYIFMVLLLPKVVIADAVVFSAIPTSKKITNNSTVQVTYTLENCSQPKNFTLPSFPQFEVVGGPMQSSNFTTINGKLSSSIAITIELAPKATGTLTIAPAQAIVEGKLLKSNPLSIEVVKGPPKPPITPPQKSKNPLDDFFEEDPFAGFFSKPQSPQQIVQEPEGITPSEIKSKVFARLELDKTKVFYGEQIMAKYCLYSQVPMQAGISKINTPEGFWSYNLTPKMDPEACEYVTLNGQQYKKFTVQKLALFPTKVGTLLVPSISLDANVQVQAPISESAGQSIGGIINNLLGGSVTQMMPVTIQTDSISVEVLPLPATDKNFSGAVGIYNLESNINQVEITTDNPVVVTYTIRGSGNLKLAPPPITFFSGDWDVTEPVVFDTVTSTETALTGYKTFKYTLLPRNTGNFFIPSAVFSYFNPSTGSYEELKSNNYTVKVLAGKNASTLNKAKALPKDIHDIITDENIQKQQRNFYIEHPLFWAAFLLPILIWGGSVWYNKRLKNVQDKEVVTYNTFAENRLSIAEEYLSKGKTIEFYKENQKAIWLYLSDILEVPFIKLSKATVNEKLYAKGVSENSILLLEKINKNSETALYSGTSAAIDAQLIYKESVLLIKQLNQEIKAHA